MSARVPVLPSTQVLRPSMSPSVGQPTCWARPSTLGITEVPTECPPTSSACGVTWWAQVSRLLFYDVPTPRSGWPQDLPALCSAGAHMPPEPRPCSDAMNGSEAVAVPDAGRMSSRVRHPTPLYLDVEGLGVEGQPDAPHGGLNLGHWGAHPRPRQGTCLPHMFGPC